MDNKEITKNADLELLNAHYDEIYNAMVEDFDMHPECEVNVGFAWDLETDDDMYYEIHGKCYARCEWHDQGDGYWTPSTPTASNGYGYVTELKITKFNGETGQYCEIDKDTIRDIETRLDEDFNDFMRTYR